MGSPDTDVFIELVADEHRRRVIQYVRHESGGESTIDEVADELCRTEDGQTDRNELLIRLHHTHLPKLADTGILEYNHQSGAIRYRGDERLEHVLDSLSDAVPVATS